MNESSNLNELLRNINDEQQPSSLSPSRNHSGNGAAVGPARSLRASHVDLATATSPRTRNLPTKQASRLQLEGTPRVSFNGFEEADQMRAGDDKGSFGSFASGSPPSRNKRFTSSKSFVDKEPEGKLKKIGAFDVFALSERPATILGTVVSVVVLRECAAGRQTQHQCQPGPRRAGWWIARAPWQSSWC